MAKIPGQAKGTPSHLQAAAGAAGAAGALHDQPTMLAVTPATAPADGRMRWPHARAKAMGQQVPADGP